jgi:ssDNA-binding Zn-finger/Zn-ribbon topoisomerase 1
LLPEGGRGTVDECPECGKAGASNQGSTKHNSFDARSEPSVATFVAP